MGLPTNLAGFLAATFMPTGSVTMSAVSKLPISFFFQISNTTMTQRCDSMDWISFFVTKKRKKITTFINYF
jgi:hypothetical protein